MTAPTEQQNTQAPNPAPTEETLMDLGLETGPTSAEPTFLPLSEVLAGIPEGERFLMLDDFEDAIRRGDVTAVPLTGERCKLSLRDKDNKTVKVDRAEELVLVDTRFQAWSQRKRAEAERALMLVTGAISITREAAALNPDRLDALAELRREYLKKTGPGKGKAEASKGKPEPRAGGKKAP